MASQPTAAAHRRSSSRRTVCLRVTLIGRTLPGAPIDRSAALPLLSAAECNEGVRVERVQLVPPQATVLLVQDVAAFRDLETTFLRRHELRVIAEESGEAARRRA